MYGARKTQNIDTPTQSEANKMRTKDVLAAEQRLLTASGITSSVDEEYFKVAN
jgi:hypothetical protein